MQHQQGPAGLGLGHADPLCGHTVAVHRRARHVQTQAHMPIVDLLVRAADRCDVGVVAQRLAPPFTESAWSVPHERHSRRAGLAMLGMKAPGLGVGLTEVFASLGLDVPLVRLAEINLGRGVDPDPA